MGTERVSRVVAGGGAGGRGPARGKGLPFSLRRWKRCLMVTAPS